MKMKLELALLVALNLLTISLVSAKCGPKYDKDWTHHEYTVLEIFTTDVYTPSADFFGTAPLQNGTCILQLAVQRGRNRSGGIGEFKGASGSCITTETEGQFLYECDFWTPNVKN